MVLSSVKSLKLQTVHACMHALHFRTSLRCILKYIGYPAIADHNEAQADMDFDLMHNALVLEKMRNFSFILEVQTK